MQEPEAAVAIVRTRGTDASILLMRRAEREGDAWSGHWSLPGGRRAECDRDPLDTALRELQEECGIRLVRAQMTAVLPPAIARRRTGPHILVAPFVFDIEAEVTTVLDAREAVEAFWMPQRTLLDVSHHSLERVPGLPAQVWFPSIVLPGAPLWGFTYRLLTDWLERSAHGCTAAGFDAANLILDFLLSRGLTARSPWRPAMSADSEEPGPVQVAEVIGTIPSDAVIDYFSAESSFARRVNRVEVWPDYIRVYGLAFEQYVIEAVTE